MKTGRVQKPMSEQNQTFVLSAILHSSFLPATFSELLYPIFQYFTVSTFPMFICSCTDLTTKSCLLLETSTECYCTFKTFTSCFYIYEERSPRNTRPRTSNKEHWQLISTLTLFISYFVMTFLVIYYSPERVAVPWLIYPASTDWIARDYFWKSCVGNISCPEV